MASSRGRVCTRIESERREARLLYADSSHPNSIANSIPRKFKRPFKFYKQDNVPFGGSSVAVSKMKNRNGRRNQAQGGIGGIASE
jgi:hypothetical protein